MHKHRVVITGIGLITPLANNAPDTWAGLLSGRSGIRCVKEQFNLGVYPYSTAGVVTDDPALLAAALPAKWHNKTDRFMQMAVMAGREAMLDARLGATTPTDRTRFGSYMGVGLGGLQTITEGVRSMDLDGLKRVSPFTIPKAINNLAPAWLSMIWNMQGPVLAMSNACASSADAVGLAFRAIRDGYIDYMLAGGTESCVWPVAIAGFGNMRALSSWQGDPSKASRPFDSQRCGFVIAEGAAVLVLERADIAQQRGAPIYAELVGYGATAEAYHITAMREDASGAVRAMQTALADAQIAADDIDYINAHGTSTIMNDQVETAAIKQVFGVRAKSDAADHVLVSSTKSMTGHMLGAAAAAEAAFSALALRDQLVPPTINLDTPDPVCDLDYVPHQSRKAPLRYALSNSFGFGGGNGVLVLKRWQ